MTELLGFSPNQFGGVVVEPGQLPDDPGRFKILLLNSLDSWTAEGYKVVWLEVPLDRASLVPIAAHSGFEYHHAKSEYVLMTLELVEGSFIPPYATHYIGAGSVVINERNEILVVSERYRLGSSRGPGYKLPGGALHPGEHIEEGAVREVLEETGVHAKFESLACFRHWHGYRYDKSDIYFVCRLSALSTEITMQEEEIAECLWMPVDEFLSERSGIHLFNKSIVRAALDNPGFIPSTMLGYDDPSRFEFFMPPKLASPDRSDHADPRSYSTHTSHAHDHHSA